MDRLQLCIATRLDELEKVAVSVDAFGAQHGIPASASNDINVALDELLNNIVSYGYPDGSGGSITIELRYQPGELCAEIRDQGIAFDPLAAGPPDLSGDVETRRIGGLGILFVKELMDDVSYARVGNENRLLMKKRIAR